MTETNVTRVSFADSTCVTSAALWQYDYGQVLQFTDVTLPASYEVHFSNDDQIGISKTQIGDADGARIPDEYLQSGRPVFVWVFLHNGEDDGETEYKVKIPVKTRARPTNYAPTEVQQSVIDQAIAALNVALEGAEAAQEAAETAQAGAETAQTGAETAQAGAEAAQTGANTAKLAAESAASLSESYAKGGTGRRTGEDTDNAKYYKEQTAALISGAQSAIEATGAEQVAAVRAEGQTQREAAAAEAAAAQAAATRAASSATAADVSASSAGASAIAADASKREAALSEGAAETAKTAAQTAASSASGSAQTAQAASQAVQNMGAAANTLAPGSAASVQKSVDPGTGAVTLTFGIPKGDKGDKGDAATTVANILDTDTGKMYTVAQTVVNGYLVETFTEVIE